MRIANINVAYIFILPFYYIIPPIFVMGFNLSKGYSSSIFFNLMKEKINISTPNKTPLNRLDLI